MPHRIPSLAIVALVLAGCAVGPDHQIPAARLEASFKNAGFSQPPPPGSWWSLFRDPELTRLMNLADQQNPGLRAALARYDQARAAIGLRAADAFPSVTGDAFAIRRRESDNANFPLGTFNDYRAALNLSWEIDLWGRVRRAVGVAKAEAEAAAYDYQAALLSLRGELARAYFSLRFADAEIALLERTAEIRAEARRLMESRAQGGASSEIDRARAATEHESVLAELAELRAQRANFENAIAALTGQSAAGFTLAPDPDLPAIPTPVGGVPSELLRRRPDLASAERRLAAASDRIGLAIATYLPRLSLTGSGGLSSIRSSDLFNSGSKLWSLGPELDLPIFQGGRGFSDRAQAEAAYREALENYRDTLLTAVRETEDSLADAKHLARSSEARENSAAAAGRASALTRKRYDAGVTDYFEVVDADRTLLTEQRAALATDLNRALAATRLIQALGGGWSR